ncbi:hypothetical protein LXM94_11055 [Rhizobium sp. TRM95111]|uniref:hypothetical protein n=1 Tax=Rhizobium alarense TaxID=2846851 RepID=UPI001F1A9FE6|nr:hypothetical protein [Rhizobium alarense]MCF3640501.1 hypothetical protein [Rhizobium alarense]
MSFSGTRGDRIFYHRAILLCRDAAAHFLIEYPQSISRQMNAFVGPLVESLKPAAGCVASPESAPNAN